MARIPVTLVAGRGIERASGALAQDQASWRRLINFFVRDGKMVARRGLEAIEMPLPPNLPAEASPYFLDTMEDVTDTPLTNHAPTPDGGPTPWEIPAGHTYVINEFDMCAIQGFVANNTNPARNPLTTPVGTKFRVFADLYWAGADALGFSAELHCFLNPGVMGVTAGGFFPLYQRNSLGLGVVRMAAGGVQIIVVHVEEDGALPGEVLIVAPGLSHPGLAGVRYILEFDEPGGKIRVFTADYLTGANEVQPDLAAGPGFPAECDIPAALLTKPSTDRCVGLLVGQSFSGGYATFWMDTFGIDTGIAYFGGFTDVVGIFPFRAIKGGVLVTYNRSTRKLLVWRVTGNGSNPSYIGEWATLLAGAPLPLISAAESYGKIFLAHAEPLYNFRAQTIYFDPTLAAGEQLVDLVGDLDDDDVAQPIKFRGVRAYLSRLWGFGYGHELDPNRPEIVRVSDGGLPTMFRNYAAFYAGARGDAVTGLLPEGGILKVYKKDSSFRILGQDASDFRIVPNEETFGLAADRLAITLGDETIFWSEHGPRIASGGKSTDIAVPLELDGEQPVGIVDAGALKWGWAGYEPNEKVGFFAFPDLEDGAKTRIYAVALRDDQLRWSYLELPYVVYAGGTIVEGDPNAGELPTGYVSALGAADSGSAGAGRQVDFDWTNNGMSGGDFYELFIKPAGGAWSLFATGAAVGATQTVTIPGFLPLTDYEAAVRITREGVPTPGYEGTDPDLWTATVAAGSKTTFTTLSNGPTIDSITWARIDPLTQRITLNITHLEVGVGFELESSATGAGSWSLVKTFPIPTESRALTYDPPAAEASTTRYYRIRAIQAAGASAYSNVESIFLGLTLVPVFTMLQSGIIAEFDLYLESLPAGFKLDVEVSPDGATAWVRKFFSETVLDPQPVASQIALGSLSHVRARFADPTSGVDDFGEWSATQTILLTNEAAPAAPAAFTSINYYEDVDIDLNFAAGGGAIGRLIRYPTAAGQGVVEVDSAAIVANLPDLLHTPVISDSHPGVYEYFTEVATPAVPLPPPDAIAASFAIVRTGGRAKVSAPTPETIRTTIDGAPTAVNTTTTGPGEINIAWTNNRADGNVEIRWHEGGGVRRFCPMLPVPTADATGPYPGHGGLPPSGVLGIGVWLQVTVGAKVYRTAYATDTHVYESP